MKRVFCILAAALLSASIVQAQSANKTPASSAASAQRSLGAASGNQLLKMQSNTAAPFYEMAALAPPIADGAQAGNDEGWKNGDHDRDCDSDDHGWGHDNDRGGDNSGLLPRGFLHTRGSQIVDCHDRPVRIAAVGWASCLGNGIVGWVPDGLNDAPLQTMMDNIAGIGFNAIRIHWADPSVRGALPYTYAAGSTNGFNPQLEGKTSLQVFDAFVQAAGKAGLKIVFDHNANEYQCGQQANGLWFDSGPGSNGTDGQVTGTVTAAQFQADTVALARRYAGNSTVIGYDLHNEPFVDSSTQMPAVNWDGRVNGDTADGGNAPGNPTDIAAMYQTVGNAVESAAPGVLIIAEGFQDWGSSASWGDLRYVSDHPLSMKVPNKLVYSAHNYPYAIGGWQPDSGPAAIASWESVFGFVETQHIAPVWIGEMGDSLDGTMEGNYESLADIEAWGNSLLSFMNGSAAGGPRFSCDQQPMSGDWWSFGYYPGGAPDGVLLDSWGSPVVRPNQQRFYSQFFFKKDRCRKQGR